MKQAVFFLNVWPETRSSAAGVRTRELMEILLENGWQVVGASASPANEYRGELEALGVRCVPVDPNQSEATEAQLRAFQPSLVLYDRFMLEEQFGWRARELWPQALHLVDTIDLHSLRRAREEAPLSLRGSAAPSPSQLGDNFLRELASLYRADGALVVSEFEEAFLLACGFPAENLLYLRFSGSSDPSPAPRENRRGFCCLGNYRHAPNLDSVRFLLAELWPAIRAALPDAELHLYGAYPPAEISHHKGKNGVISHGHVLDHRAALRTHVALLSPLRFGAGIKGKVLEAWGTGTPVVGTALSFEGTGAVGILAETAEQFVESCVRVCTDTPFWLEQSRSGAMVVAQHFSRAAISERFLSYLAQALPDLAARRDRNLTGRLLRHQSANSTKYFSRWIEAKNLLAPRQATRSAPSAPAAPNP